MRLNRFVFTAAVLAVPAGSVSGCSQQLSQSESVGTTAAVALANIVQHPSRDACGPAPTGQMRCNAKIRTDVVGTTAPQGFGPPDLVKAYNLPATGGSGQTVAVVDAQDDPTAESDLAVYRAQYGLPACTTANGCFKKVNQNGEQGSYPQADSGWAEEISLDLDMISAVCPSCNIILVEANSATTPDLGASVQTAAKLGATAISNSYGGDEDPSDAQSSAQYYNQPGILVTASAGDNGYGAQFPASSEFVLGVGGTSLVTDTSARGWAEGAWSGTGSGCSANIGKPSFQTDDGCSMRTVADVSAVADPNTGVAVYVSYGGDGGWNVLGGTSAASPLVAAMFALVGKTGQPNSFAYANTSAFYDVTTGSNGTCDQAYLCNAGAGYDGPTGWGTPNGVALAAANNSAAPVTATDAGAGANDAGEGSGPGGGPTGAGQDAAAGSGPGSSASGSSPASSATGGTGGTGGAGSGSDAGSQDDASSQDGASPDGGSQDGVGSQDGSSSDVGSQDGASSASASQDGFSSSYTQGGSQDASSSSYTQGGSQDGSSSSYSQGGSQDGSSSSSSYTSQDEQTRRPHSRPAAWRRLGKIVKGAIGG